MIDTFSAGTPLFWLGVPLLIGALCWILIDIMRRRRRSLAALEGSETAHKLPKSGLPEGYEHRARLASATAPADRAVASPFVPRWAPAEANAVGELHAKLVKLQAMLSTLSNAQKREDLARVEILLQEIRDLLAHRDWQGPWEQRTLENAIEVVENALSAPLAQGSDG